MNVLIIGTKRKLLPVYDYCKKNQYNILCIRNDDHENNSQILNNNSIWIKDVTDQILYNFLPDQIINFKEQKYFLKLEYDLNTMFKLETFLTENLIKFFSSKMEQDRIFKSLNIPTVPNKSNIVIVKSDSSGGTNFKVTERDKVDQNYFVQDYLSIDYIISCHFYSDGNKWYHLNNHIIKYEENCPSKTLTPYQLTGNDKNIIDQSIQKLSKKIKIKNKLFGWQFLKDQRGNLYSIDFNLRPFGGFDMGSYDTDTSNQNWSSYIFGNVPPEYITYTDTIECFYKKKQRFGYSDVNRVKTKLTNFINFKVNIYD